MTQNSAAPAISPELRQWIVEQTQAGVPTPGLLRAMLDAGWQESVAVSALESTLRQHLEKTAPQALQQLPEASTNALPEPSLQGSPSWLDLGDRKVSVLCSLAHPRVVVFGGFLSAEECDALVAAAQPRMSRSLTVASQTGGEEVNADRTSDGMFFRRGEITLVQRIEERIARLLNYPMDRGEGLQILHYRPGAEYKPHYDYFDPTQPGSAAILARGGQRIGTLLMYLNTPQQGGGTTFPDVQLEIAPIKGNAVFFSYDRPHPATRTLHGGAPVLAGDKWIATKWLREGVFK